MKCINGIQKEIENFLLIILTEIIAYAFTKF